MRTREHPEDWSLPPDVRGGAPQGTRPGGAAPASEKPLVNLSEIAAIELIILRRMREFSIGDHRSQFQGIGFDFVGLREWQAGDRFSSIDWPQSTLTNFRPLMVRDFEQPSTATVVPVADTSLSTRCGIDGVRIAGAIARALATLGMSAVFFQDLFGLITFDDGFRQVAAVRPRVGKGQVIHCLEAYQFGRGVHNLRQIGALSMTISGFLRKTTLVPIISDFLFANVRDVVKELSLLNSSHDAFLIMVDSSFAFELPQVSAGWIEAFDVETSTSRVMSRRTLRRLADKVRDWQEDVARAARDVGMDVLRLGQDPTFGDIALFEFVVERRLRKTAT